MRCRPHAVVLLLLATSACTAPTRAESLPSSEPWIPQVIRYRSLPEAPELRPPIASLRLLATNREHARWAASDGRRLWIASGDGSPVEHRRDHATRLRSIAIDDDGDLWLLDEHDRLARVDASGAVEELAPLPVEPLDDVGSLVLGAGRVVIIGWLRDAVEPPPLEPGEVLLDEQLMLAISDDGGREWRLRRRPENGSERDDLRIAPDGSMQLMDGDERSCGGGWQARWTSHVDRLGWKALEWPLDTRDNRDAGAQGWSYGFDEGFHAVGRSGAHYLLHPVETRYAFAHDGRAGVLLADGGMWSITGRKPARIGDLAPELADARIDALAIAHQGAVMVTVEKSIFVGSAQGWRSIELGAEE